MSVTYTVSQVQLTNMSIYISILYCDVSFLNKYSVLIQLLNQCVKSQGFKNYFLQQQQNVDLRQLFCGEEKVGKNSKKVTYIPLYLGYR